MTSDQIKEAVEDFRSEKGWLKEIAWQLARLNDYEHARLIERNSVAVEAPIPPVQIARRRGRPPRVMV